jgi:hypothetical protein
MAVVIIWIAWIVTWIRRSANRTKRIPDARIRFALERVIGGTVAIVRGRIEVTVSSIRHIRSCTLEYSHGGRHDAIGDCHTCSPGYPRRIFG